MDPLIIMAGIVLAPVVILSLFRVNAAIAFLALCLGSALSGYVASDTVEMLRGFIAQTPELNNMIISLLLLWLPVLVIAIFMLNTISKKQVIINMLPAVMVGLFGLLLSVPFLTPDLNAAISGTNIYQQILSYQAVVVAAGTVVSLVFLRMRKKSVDKHSKHQ